MRTVPVTGEELRARLATVAQEEAQVFILRAACALSHLVFQHEMTAGQARARLLALVDDACTRIPLLVDEGTEEGA